MANGRGGHYGGRALGVTNPGGLRVKPVLPSKSRSTRFMVLVEVCIVEFGATSSLV